MSDTLPVRFGSWAPKLEHALYVSALEDLRFFFEYRFQRIYFGCEFCHHLLPTPSQLRCALAFASRYHAKFTFVTPFLPESGLRKAVDLIGLLPAGSEVIINDWGLLQAVRMKGLVPIAGRLLIKIKRDPRITKEDLQKPEFSRYLRSSNLTQPSFVDFLIGHGIARSELDNVQQGWDLNLPPRMRTSLYYPYVQASVTRRCARLVSPNGAARKRETLCRRDCGDLVLECQALSLQGRRYTAHKYFMCGAELFFINVNPPADRMKRSLDRLVYMPRLPMSRSRHTTLDWGDWEAMYAAQGTSVAWGYDKPERLFLQIFDRYRPEIAAARPRILDLGCGNGRNAVAMKQRGMQVVGLDVSKTALDQLRRRCPGIPTIIGSALKLPFAAGFFDVVVDHGCLHTLHPADHETYVANVARVLRKGGLYFLCVRMRPTTHDPMVPVIYVHDLLPEWGVTPEQLKKMFAQEFEMLSGKSRRGDGSQYFYRAVFRRKD